MKRLALLLYGSSLDEYYHWSNKIYSIDYRNSYKNYKKFIFDYFEKKGYDIDIYFTTNLLKDDDKEIIYKYYKPVKCNFIRNEIDRFVSKKKKIVDVVNLCLQNNQNYDLVLMTRFDLIFKKNFNKSNIQLDKFNLVSILEIKNSICDNFYLFPYKFLTGFLNILETNLEYHFITNEIYEQFGKESVNIILNQKCRIQELSFYKIYRKEKKFKRKNTNLIINKLDNKIYFNYYSQVYKTSNNSFSFSKDMTYNTIIHQWCGYNIIPKSKITKMKFDIIFFSEVPSHNSNFCIKTHNPIQKHNNWLIQCKKNEFVSIEIILELNLIEQLIIFFSDEYLPEIYFYVKNIEFIDEILNKINLD